MESLLYLESTALVNLETFNDAEFGARLSTARTLVNGLSRGSFDKEKGVAMESSNLADVLQHAQTLGLSIPEVMDLRTQFVEGKHYFAVSLTQDDPILRHLTKSNLHTSMVDLATRKELTPDDERRLFTMLITAGAKIQDIDPLRKLAGAI